MTDFESPGWLKRAAADEDRRLRIEEAAAHLGIPTLVEQPRPEPKLPTAPPAGRLVTEMLANGWLVANDPRWVRLCPSCGNYTGPREGLWPVTCSFLPETTTPPPIEDPLWCNVCPRCHEPWPGPMLKAWTMRRRKEYDNAELALIGTEAIAKIRLSPEILGHQQAVQHAWAELEHAILDRIAEHPMCHVRSCTERADARYARTIRPAIVPFDLMHNQERFDVCRRHRYDLLRDPEIGPGIRIRLPGEGS